MYPEQDNTVFLFHFDLIVKTAQKYWDQIVWKITKSKDLSLALPCKSHLALVSFKKQVILY